MNKHEKRARKVWDDKMEVPVPYYRRPERGRTDHAVAVAYGSRGWVGPHGEKHTTREEWRASLSP